jgi:D-xylonolactonase
MVNIAVQRITSAKDLAFELAENPLWDSERNSLYWTDITAGKIYSLDLNSGLHHTIYDGPAVGGFTLQGSRELLLFRVDDIATLAPTTGAVSILQRVADDGMARFNDVIADPEGRVFAGTIGKTNQSGGLYRLERSGTLRKLFSGTGCSNGMGFSPDGKTFYWTCSTTRRIFRFDYEQTSGELSNPRLFYQADEKEGMPDGMAVDEDGCVWSARWGGACVVRHSARGEPLVRIGLPVANVTSVCFGGENLDQLFITSARSNGPLGTMQGALFQARTPLRGWPRFKSRIE